MSTSPLIPGNSPPISGCGRPRRPLFSENVVAFRSPRGKGHPQDLLRGLAGALAACPLAPRALLASPREERVLSFFHTHTNERLTVPYFAEGSYLPEGLAELRSFLKDFRTGEEHAIDPGLFDILNDLRLATGTKSPFHVISGLPFAEHERDAA